MAALRGLRVLARKDRPETAAQLQVRRANRHLRQSIAECARIDERVPGRRRGVGLRVFKDVRLNGRGHKGHRASPVHRR